jgi:hypothetical protein
VKGINDGHDFEISSVVILNLECTTCTQMGKTKCEIPTQTKPTRSKWHKSALTTKRKI